MGQQLIIATSQETQPSIDLDTDHIQDGDNFIEAGQKELGKNPTLGHSYYVSAIYSYSLADMTVARNALLKYQLTNPPSAYLETARSFLQSS